MTISSVTGDRKNGPATAGRGRAKAHLELPCRHTELVGSLPRLGNHRLRVVEYGLRNVDLVRDVKEGPGYVVECQTEGGARAGR